MVSINQGYDLFKSATLVILQRILLLRCVITSILSVPDRLDTYFDIGLNVGEVLWSSVKIKRKMKTGYCFYFYGQLITQNSFIIDKNLFLIHTGISLVSSCNDLSCAANQICLMVGNTYQCVCTADYKGENCEELGKRYASYIFHICFVL